MTLEQHLRAFVSTPLSYRPDRCPHCGSGNLWGNRFYDHKADHSSHAALNPVPVPRFRCPACSHTCSRLPLCSVRAAGTAGHCNNWSSGYGCPACRCGARRPSRDGLVGPDVQLEGIDVDTVQLVAQKLGVKLQLVPVTAPARVACLQTGKADITISSPAQDTRAREGD